MDHATQYLWKNPENNYLSNTISTNDRIVIVATQTRQGNQATGPAVMRDTSIFIIHSDEPEWEAVRRSLHGLPHTHLIGTVATADGATRQTSRYRPELILASNRLGGDSSFPILAEIRSEYSPDSLIGVFARRMEPAELRRFSQIGLSGFCRWDELSSLNSIREAIRAMLTTDLIVGTRSIVRDYFYVQRGTSWEMRRSIHLTDGDLHVLQLLATGLTRKEICNRTRRSTRTIDRRIDVLKDKLGAPTLASLVFRAVQLDLIPWTDGNQSS